MRVEPEAHSYRMPENWSLRRRGIADPCHPPLNRMPAAISHLTDFCSGRLKQRTLLLIFIPLILVSYFGSLTFAIWLFPGPFD